MRARLRKIIVALIATLFAQSSARGDLVVESWLLDTGVSSDVGQAFQFSDTVQNPYQEIQLAAQVNSYATATFDFGWLGDSAHFDLQTSHYLEQLRGFTVSEGSIYVRPAVDTNINLDGSWQFSWPSSVLGQTIISLVAYDVDADQVVAFANAGGGNTGLGPPYGDLHVQNNGVLQADGYYQIYYVAQIYHSTSTPPGTHGEGSGEIHFTITPVPEPATLALFAIAFLIPRRRSGYYHMRTHPSVSG